MSELYDNLLKATDNTSDITNEKYGTVTKINGALCSVIEEDTNLEHTNVPVLNQIYLETGDKVVIGFVSNSIYNPIIVGNLTRRIRLSADDIIEPSSLNNLGLPANSSQHQINLKVNEKINQGGGSGGSVDWSDIENKPSDYPPSSHNHDSRYYTESEIDTALSNKADVNSLSTVATTGDYDDLIDKPTIPSKTSDLVNDTGFITPSALPTKTSDLTNDGDGTNAFLTQHQSLANYVQKSSTSGLLKNDGSVDTTQYLSSLPSHNHDDRYYTETEIDNALNSKQDTLISGTNIKTINNTSLLGSGNINIQGGGTVTVDDSLSTTSTNPVQNKVVTGALNSKANSSHTHLSSDVTDLIDVIYPVGSIYMSVNNVSPSALFGGTWEQIKDKFLLASGSTYSTGATGGSADAVVVSHKHNIENDDYYFVGKKKSDVAGTKRVTVPTSGSNYAYVSNGSTSFGHFGITKSSGESGTGKNMPPYLVVNVWKRTA